MGCPYCKRCGEYFKDKTDYRFHMRWHDMMDKFGRCVVKMGYNKYYVTRERYKAKPGMYIEMWCNGRSDYIPLTEELLTEIITKGCIPTIGEGIALYEEVFKSSIMNGKTNFGTHLSNIIEANINKMIEDKMKKE